MRTPVFLYGVALAFLIALAGGGAAAFFAETGPDDVVDEAADEHGYDFIFWEIENFPQKWAYKLHHFVRGENRLDDEAVVQEYFALSAEITRLSGGEDAESLQAARRQRNKIEADFEDILEGRITSVLEEQGLVLEPPLFSDLGIVFPPVDFELDSPPRVLAISPRDQIELDRSFLLEPGLDRETFADIEAKAESGNGPGASGVSALVVGTGGVATYPSVISAEDDYAGTVEIAFHEWLHQYLIFFPLGRSYFEGAETRTLNESVASLGGKALAEAYFARYGGLEPPQTHAAPTQPQFDFTEAMRALRREVEALLDDGKVIEAEALMEQRREEFADHGYTLRKLNQAYFAFHGFYADSPGSIDPIGPKLQALLDHVQTPGRFVIESRGVTSREELDEVLARLSR